MSIETVLPFTLRWEGGYVNDPQDPGGATNKGVTQRVYNNYRMSNKLPVQPVKFISDAEVRDIYKNLYYDLCGCGDLPKGLEAVVFDTAVNMGVGAAKEMLKMSGNDMYKYLQLRMIRYDNIIKARPTSEKYRKGWTNRVTDLRRFAEEQRVSKDA